MASLKGNLPGETAVGETVVRDITGYDAAGNSSTISMTFTKTASGWDMSLAAGGTTTNGVYGTDTTLTAAGITVDLSEVTSYVGADSIDFHGQNDRSAGVIESYSNGTKEVIAVIALANFANPEGLEKAGSSTYTASLNSGQATVGVAGANGNGKLAGGALEMSNVDMANEMTNLILAQRGFQASARVTTVSDSLLEEMISLKR